MPHTEPDPEALASDLVVAAARLVRAVRRRIEQPTGMRMLALLDEFGPTGVTRLAELDRCSQPTMSGAVASLEQAGWVTRERDPDDARRSVVTLTAAGSAALAETRRANGRIVADRLAHTHHTAEDLATTVAVLRDLLGPDPEGTDL